MADEVRRLGKLMRAFVWGQLLAGAVWAFATAWAGELLFRFGLLAAVAVVSAIALKLETRGRIKTAAALIVGTVWIGISIRTIQTGWVGHGAWFMNAVLVGEVGLFIGWRAALVMIVSDAAFGATIILLVKRGAIIELPPPAQWLDWASGVLVFTLIGILIVAAVRLYRGALDIARRAADRHRALFDGAPIALFELDLRDSSRVVVTDVNDTARRLLGGDREPPADVIEVVLEAMAAGARAMDREITLQIGGEPCQIVVRAELPANREHVIVGLADVTEQRKLAEHLHDARRLETVASLAGSVAHDFNNLLTVSSMNADRLRRKNASLTNSQELERIRDVNTRAATLTRQLLVFSRRDVPHRQVFAAGSVIAKLEPLWRRTLDSRINLVVSTTTDAPVDMDPAQLELLVTNLVANAIDAMPADGTLRIECATKGDRVAIAVSDTGQGMTASIRDRAFEPFFTTRPGKRAGLGLSTVNSIVRDAAGSIDISSSDKGTRVEVLLPAAGKLTQTLDATPGSERILLVEDDDGVREIARSTLEDAGYSVVAVRNGAEALETMAVATNIDLVVSDLVMPGIGGRELVGRLRTTHPTMPVLYVSGHAADGPPMLEGEARIGFLAKPFTAAQLLASVRSVLPAEVSQ